GLKNFVSTLGSTYNKYNQSWPFNRCGYNFMVEESQYSFSTADLNDTKFYQAFPIVLDWSIGNQTCQQVLSSKPADYTCRSEHSKCIDSNNGVGYICNCSDGYIGNPYLEQGCQDIDECADKTRYPCKGICTNAPGSYTCLCPEGYSSPDPTRERCVSDGGSSPTISLPTKLGIGFGAIFLLLLTAGSWAYWGFQKRRLLQLKHKFFQQNGGLFLQQHISSHQGGMAFRIFTEDELARATGNFDDAQILGRGGHGTVYKGIVEDGREIAIKRSRTVDERQSKEFAREMLILSQINHRNIVKLLGCCLEVEVPMLVYEFVPNGTFFGVVLVELITGKKALHFDGPGEDKSLAMSFVSAFKENRLVQILEAQLLSNGGEEMGVLKEVAELAHQCLRLKGEERPTMKEVARTLQGLEGSEAHPWVPHNPGEVESLLSEAPSGSYLNTDTGTEYLSLRSHAMLHIDAGR
ncbi:hypothetical protein Taro_025755, partial [Colocasia esculenta]|nr:hypothetical protein [Colocasia esculenta]